ncbi:hypothetical protein RSOL_454510 [Rhizoctonia solani AG-3 Rhs1AP]|uniref:Uncharacterized protein n=2 Tax=Rhizoctonia solani AG-3 TaxID=1086053 RepID=X8JGJ5_9AGAM|nr:hypothetical protein RSOL_454510 [Rhizoctonia solani AG-3 Rhs1AP]
MTAFPRAIFSGKELDVVRWFAEKCHIPGMPSQSTIQSRFELILKMLGLESRLVWSKLGNHFAVNSIKAILANEMANPLVQKDMVFYPQDDGPSLRQAANGKRWTEEIRPALAAPMARKYLVNGHQDYFVYEPFLASTTGTSTTPSPNPYMPFRYFEREGELFARAHLLIPHQHNGKMGFLVDIDSHSEIPLSQFLLPLPEFCLRHKAYGLPSPESIIGKCSVDTLSQVEAWTEPVENPWRKRANGKMLRSLPLWLYCDNTSGNLSKKWNKHNSFLFTIAGLPRDQTQLPYNIHFLATSNIASPLEMLEEIASELNDALLDGVMAYDCKVNEDVIIVPWVYAMQGDNPMQSELCSHIGMTGKFFCRICKVWGKDKDQVNDQESEIERVQEFMKEARKTGVKDKYLTAFLAIMKDKLDAYPSRRSRQDTIEVLKKLRQNIPDKPFNPALLLPGRLLNSPLGL